MISQTSRKIEPHLLAQRAPEKSEAGAETKDPFAISARAQHAQGEKEREETKGRRERIGPTRHVDDCRALHRMQHPDERRKEGDSTRRPGSILPSARNSSAK